jgi:hypothetical protein
MKKIVFILLFAMCVAPASRLLAQQQPMDQPPAGGGGMLRVQLADRTPISIALDGRYFRNNGRSLTVGDLPEGQHYLKIYTHTPGRGEMYGRGGRQLLFEGNVDVYQGQVTMFLLNAYTGDTKITQGNINTDASGRPNYQDYGYNGVPDNQGGNGYQGDPNTPPNNNGGYDQNNGNMPPPPPNGYTDQGNVPPPPNGYQDNNAYSQNGNGYNSPNNGNTPPPNGYNDNQGNNAPPPSNGYPDNSQNGNGYNPDGGNVNNNSNNYNGNGGYRYGGSYNDGSNGQNPAAAPAPHVATTVDQPYMDKLQVKVNNKITDTDKQKLLETLLAKQTVSTAQVSTIMGWLNFESSRVAFAKWAYSIVVDKRNYQSLGKQFTYQSSRDELNSYINSNK